MQTPPAGGQQYYQQYSAVPPSYPVGPMPSAPTSGGNNVPWFLYVGAGFIIANLLGKVKVEQIHGCVNGRFSMNE